MMHEHEKSDPEIVAVQCRMRHCTAYADWRTMPNGFRMTPCSRGFAAGPTIVVPLASGIVCHLTAPQGTRRVLAPASSF